MNLNEYIDHTILKPETTEKQVSTICKEAIEHKFASVCVNSKFTKFVANALKGSSVKTCVVIGFPLGAMASDVKVFETDYACKNGANEIDMVLAIGELKSKNFEYVLNDIKAVVDKAREYNSTVKVIMETCLLTDEEKIKACELSVKAGAAYVKTSTGFSSGGATADDVKLMKSIVKDAALVKASGGVRDFNTAKEMISIGASRIGTSNGVTIMQGGTGEGY